MEVEGRALRRSGAVNLLPPFPCSPRLRHAALLGCCLALVGCAVELPRDEPGPPEPPDLGEVDVPPDADLSGVRSVTVTVSATARALPSRTATVDGTPLADGAGAFEVLRADGEVLHEGRLTVRTPVTARLLLPARDAEVRVRLLVPAGAARTATARVQDGAASVTFDGEP